MSERTWPADELEDVDRCPVCADSRRDLLHRELTDRVFRAAPGHWTTWRCRGCGAGYLGPRPTQASIGRAYGSYYTHGDSSAARLLDNGAGALRRLAVRLGNGRINSCLGYARRPSSVVGAALVPLFVRRDRELLWKLRHVHAHRGEARLLDVGCGNGQYLELMRSVGWQVAGVDPDPVAVAAAVEAGLDARLGTLRDAAFPSAHFEAVTLSHTIEHVHDPVGVLTECRRVLTPGGVLVVVTPNLDSAGHGLFGVDWLHLDPPRHLVLFTVASLRLALARAGFTDVRQLPARLRGASARPSAALRSGADALHPPALSTRMRLAAAIADVRSLRHPERAEEVALLARAGN